MTASLVACSTALLGVFLLLRKMTMIADAISHAVLPGIVLAYLISGSRDSFIMLLGAAIFGMLVTLLIEFLHKKGKMQEDAAIGISFTGLFAVGVILISLFTGKIDLDQDCVLYGEIAYVPLDTVVVGNLEVPQDTRYLMILFVIIVLFIIIFYKGLFLSTFDATYASTLGIAVGFWHYTLMGMVSLTTVFSFESVGAILVITLLVGPAAGAYLLTTQLKKMLFLACFLGIFASISGYYLAVWINGSIAGAIATMVGVEFMLIFIFQQIFEKKLSKFSNFSKMDS